jgi:hypothetical protein
MFKILPDIRKHLGPPLVAMVALIPIVIPLLCKSDRCYRCLESTRPSCTVS